MRKHRIPRAATYGTRGQFFREKKIVGNDKFRQTLKYAYYILVWKRADRSAAACAEATFCGPTAGRWERVVVYLDLIFLANFFMDGAVLAATASVRKIRASWWRIAIASAVGASYAVMMLFPSLSFMFTLFIKCFFSVGMVWIAFGYGGLKPFLRNLATFYLVNFAAAGFIFGLHYALQSSGEVWNGILVTRSGELAFRVQIASIFVLAAFPLSIWFFRSVAASVKRKHELARHFAEVRIHIGDRTTVCTGLIDTGNRLYDPLTRTPVMVIEASQWNGVFPETWLPLIRNAEVDRLADLIGETEFEWRDRLRLIPYRGLNKGTQFMLAVKPDKVVVVHHETEIATHKVLIGLDGGKLCSDGSYQAIIHPALLQKEA